MSSVNKIILVGIVESIDVVTTYGIEGMLISISTLPHFKKDSKEAAKSKPSVSECLKILLNDSITNYANKFLKIGDCVFIEGLLRLTIWLDDKRNKHTTSIPHARVFQILSTPVSEKNGHFTGADRDHYSSMESLEYSDFQLDFDDEYRQA